MSILLQMERTFFEKNNPNLTHFFSRWKYSNSQIWMNLNDFYEEI